MTEKNGVYIPKPIIQHHESGMDSWCWYIVKAEPIDRTLLENAVNFILTEDSKINFELIDSYKFRIIVFLPSDINYTIAFDLNMRILIILENAVGSFVKIQDVSRTKCSVF